MLGGIIRAISKMLSKVTHWTFAATLRLQDGCSAHCLLQGWWILVQTGSVRHELPLLCGTISGSTHSQVLSQDAAMNLWTPPHCGGASAAACPGGAAHSCSNGISSSGSSSAGSAASGGIIPVHRRPALSSELGIACRSQDPAAACSFRLEAAHACLATAVNRIN
jgi:hypothetical protein